MKKFILVLLVLSSQICLSQEEFFVGSWLNYLDLMYESGYGHVNIEQNDIPYVITPIDSVTKQGFKTSRVNVLKDFGVNFVWMGAPSAWSLSGVNSNLKVFNLFKNHGIKVIGDVDYWFKPLLINGNSINTIGTVDFNGEPNNSPYATNNLARPNYNAIISELETNPMVYGYLLGGELAYRSGHFYNPGSTKIPEELKTSLGVTSEISPQSLQLAIDSVRKLTRNSLKKIVLQVGTHTYAINENTDDFRYHEDRIDGSKIPCRPGYYHEFYEDVYDVDPQDYFQNSSYYPHLVIEGSYFGLNLENSTINNFSYPITSFVYKYSNIQNCGRSPDGYPLNYSSSNSCTIKNITWDKCGNSLFGDNRHYLSKFHNINYFTNKGIDVISEFAGFVTKYEQTDSVDIYVGSYLSDLGNWNSTGLVNNANYFWFNAYNSIIHGAIGIIPYIEYPSLYFNPCEETMSIAICSGINQVELKSYIYNMNSDFFTTLGISQSQIVLDCNNNYNGLIPDSYMNYYKHIITKAIKEKIFTYNGEFDQSKSNSKTSELSNSRFDYSFWPIGFQDFIAPLYNEISLLVRLGFLNKSSVLYRKLDNYDDKCIVPAANSYIKTKDGNNPGIPPSYTSFIQDYYNLNGSSDWYTGPTDFDTEFSNENYGLRYVLLSNQDRDNEEYILIVSNPMNLPILDVPLNISHFPVLRDMSEAQLLFTIGQEVVDQTGILNSNYKTQRKLNFSWEESTLDEIQSVFIPINNSKTFSLDFGPLDVHIIRFKRNACTTPPLRKVWSDLNTGRIGGHTLNQNDKPLVIGNFYGDESDEALIVKYQSNGASWATTQMFVNGNFTNAFNNAGNGWLNRQPLGWFIGNDDVFLAGNFINNAAGDEVLCIQDPQTQVVNRAAAMIGFKDDVADWDYWYWSNISDRTKIGSWALTANSKYYIGNFDNDFLDEVMFVRYNNAFIVEIKIQKYNNQSGTWDQVLSINNPNLGYNMKITVGDFINSDGKDDIFITNGYNAKLLKIQGQSLIEVWNNNNSLGNLGSTVQPSWNLNSTDIVTSGKFYNPINSSDNLLLIRNPSFNNSNSNASAEIVYYNSYTNKWYSSWSNYACCNSLLDWKIIDNDYTKIEYNPIRLIDGNDLEEALLNTHLLATRGIESITQNCWTNNMNANMYTFSNLNNAKSTLNLENPIIEANDNHEIHFVIIPNPTKTGITIQGNHSELIDDIEVWDILGKKLFNKREKSHAAYLDLSDYNKGMYIIKVFSNDKVFINKVLKE